VVLWRVSDSLNIPDEVPDDVLVDAVDHIRQEDREGKSLRCREKQEFRREEWPASCCTLLLRT